jgi:hypothetical protein
MITGEQERTLSFKHRPVVDNDLSAKDQHRKTDDNFEGAIKHLRKIKDNR